jgi:hypothetical protein
MLLEVYRLGALLGHVSRNRLTAREYRITEVSEGVPMASGLSRAELAAFVDTVRELLEDGDLDGLGSIVLRGEARDIAAAARDMLRRVEYYRQMDPKERAALGPLTMRHQLADDLALLREALQAAGLLWIGGSGDRLPVRARPSRLRPGRRR